MSKLQQKTHFIKRVGNRNGLFLLFTIQTVDAEENSNHLDII